MSPNARPAEDASVFRFGDFAFDGGSRQLLHGGVERHLSPKAQQLLQLLLQERPRAMSREALYDALWPSTFVCETNLASIVNEVRRALGDDARASQYIRTVHGFGYAFCGEVALPVSIGFGPAILRCEGESFPLFEGENLIGRVPGCRVLINAPTVSRRHAVIRVENDEYTIEDLDSKNGTFVNEQRVGRAPVVIGSRARIRFGAAIGTVIGRNSSSTQSLRLDSAQRNRLVQVRQQ